MLDTGERYMPDFDRDWTLEHVHRYLLARELAAGKDVLDIACGEGYGSALLAARARQVTGVDISSEIIAWASRKYQADNLRYREGSATAIPLDENSVDLVVSFETIEHLAEQEAMLREIKRVLRPQGVLIISSPDKYEYSDIPGFHNEFHVRELYAEEFERLLNDNFTHHQMLGQRIVFGSLVAGSEKDSFVSWQKDSLESFFPGLSHAEYCIAIAGDGVLPALPHSILKGTLEEADKVVNLRESLNKAQNRIHELEQELVYCQKLCADFQQQLRRAWEETRGVEEKYRGETAYRIKVQNELEALLHSHSWKMTRPLRSVAAGLRELRGLGRQATPVADVPDDGERSGIWPPDVRALEMRDIVLDGKEPERFPRTGVFLHVYYPDILEEMLQCVAMLPEADIFISTDSAEKRSCIRRTLDMQGLAAQIRICPNQGWDIAPFLIGFADVIPEYPLILRLHSKCSPQLGETGTAWRKMLYKTLAGDRERVNGIVNAFTANPDLGMACPPVLPYYARAVHMGGNYRQMHELLKRFNIDIRPDTPIDFPMGSMFWCRPQVLAPWLSCDFSYEDFAPQAEDIRDSSLAHALERLFFFGCGIAGCRWARLPE